MLVNPLTSTYMSTPLLKLRGKVQADQRRGQEALA